MDNYRLIQSYLLKENVQFQSYVLEDAKPLRLVFRGLPLNTATHDIKNALELDDIMDVSVTQIYSGHV